MSQKKVVNDSDEKTSDPDFSEPEQKVTQRFTQQNSDKNNSGKKNSSQEKEKQKLNSSRNMPIPVKSSNFVVRTIWTLAMLGGYILIIAAGHFYCAFLVLLLTVGIFKEIVSLRRNLEKEKQIPWFFTLNWYFFVVAVFFCYGKLFSQKLVMVVLNNKFIYYVSNYHNFISFMLWVIGFLIFVMSLQKGFYRYQFRQFAWTHICCFLIVGQSSVMTITIYEGQIWWVMSSLMIITNDIFAYIFGMLFGRTQLTELSPKKTWEGFIGGFLSSMFFAIIFSKLFVFLPALVCPQESFNITPFQFQDCNYGPHFIPEKFAAPMFLQLFGVETIWWSDFQNHAIIMSIFASLVAPFGGFFASGFKRAMKIKDFADIIPGHGGITDRMDCQLLMGMFSYVYIHQIVLNPTHSINNLIQFILALNVNDQLQIFRELEKILTAKQIINNSTLLAN